MVVKCAEIVEQFECTHDRLWCWWVHIVERYKVIDAQLLEFQHGVGQVTAQDLRIRLLDQLTRPVALRIQAIALTWTCTASATCPLLG